MNTARVLQKSKCIGMSEVQGGPLGGTSVIQVGGTVVKGKKSTSNLAGVNYSDS